MSSKKRLSSKSLSVAQKVGKVAVSLVPCGLLYVLVIIAYTGRSIVAYSLVLVI